MSIEIRLATEADLAEAFRVRLLTYHLDDLVATLEPGLASSMVWHVFETGSLYVADTGSSIAGFVGIVKRDAATILSSLFVKPDLQSSKVGQRLLETALRQATHPLCCVSSADPRAIALYARAGMVPHWPHFSLAVSASGLRQLPASEVDVIPVAAVDDDFSAMDAEISGRYRPIEHRFFVEQQGGIPLWFEHRGQRIGYGFALVRCNSFDAGFYENEIALGPIGARSTQASESCLLAAVRWAAERTDLVTLEISGPHPALKTLLNAGMQINGMETFMASDPLRFGNPRLYLPSGGSLY